MPESDGETRPIILHIHSGETPEAVAALLERACAAGARVETLGDVYRGLARLGAGEKPHAVVVCADELLAHEFEFFKLAGRVRGGVPVHVYAGEGMSASIAEAAAAGAAGPFDAATLASLCEVGRTPHSTTAPEAARTGQGASAKEREARAALGEAQPEAHDSSPELAEELEPGAALVSGELRNGDANHVPLDDASRDDELEQTEPVRVPWLRYEEQPARVPPRRSPPARSEQAGPGANTPHSDGPLLTEEEVRALIGDDVSSFPSRGDEHHPD